MKVILYLQAGEAMDREITGTYGGYIDGIPEDAMNMIREMNKKSNMGMIYKIFHNSSI